MHIGQLRKKLELYDEIKQSQNLAIDWRTNRYEVVETDSSTYADNTFVLSDTGRCPEPVCHRKRSLNNAAETYGRQLANGKISWNNSGTTVNMSRCQKQEKILSGIPVSEMLR